MSRAGPENVPGRSRKCPGRVPKIFRVGSDRVPAGSGGVLAVVYQFENVTLKLEKWFTVLKRGNHFTEIKEDFSVKLKMIFVDYYFTPHQTPKNINEYKSLFKLCSFNK
jgi:hypothetical protein